MTALEVAARVAARGLDVEFGVAAGEVLAILGPNGAGKSSTLHVIAGLLRPDAGSVWVGSRALTDVAARIQVPTHDRRIGLLQQHPRLFPHLRVLDNVAFAPRSRRGTRNAGRAASHGPSRITRKQAAQIAMRLLGEVDAADLADRYPAALSGGQAQRVAIARALAADPEVLLVDEPFTGLDVGVAAAIRTVLRRTVTAAGRPTVLITHDLLDVLALADRVLVLEAGRIAEVGSVTAVLTEPRSGFGAQIAGLNLVRGTIRAGGVLRTVGGELWHGVTSAGLEPGDAAVAVFSPAAVSVYREQPHGSPRNAVLVRVAELADVGGGVIRVRGLRAAGAVDMPGVAADITAEAVSELRLATSDRVWFTVKAQEVALHAGSR